MESILTSIKKLLGISEEYEHFDVDIIMHINSVFMDLNQLGVGPSECFSITDDEDVWSDFTDNIELLQSVKSYMYLRVKILFDAASIGSATLAAYERQIAQWEWRLNVAAESNDSLKEDTKPSVIPETISGVVVDCVKLNVRSEPAASADVVSVLSVNAKVMVDTTRITGDWYYIYTENGVRGYCLKTNIRVYL